MTGSAGMLDRGEQKPVMSRKACEAGWRVSRYNLYVPLPDTDKTIIANTYSGSCASYSPAEMYLLSVLNELDEDHPVLRRFSRRGIIVDFDEKAALESMARGFCAYPGRVSLSICPTMGCNFDCPYCFESHRAGKMSEKVRADVAALAGRMLAVSHAGQLRITWFGGEPLLYPEIIESMSRELMRIAGEHHAGYKAHIVTNGYLLTPGITEMLRDVKVDSAQITLDGIGAAHDRTRHLQGGGATFGRIVSNLRHPGIPFAVRIRQNVHADNLEETEKLRDLIARLKEESGNDLSFNPALVDDSPAHRQREEQVMMLCGPDLTRFGIEKESAGLKRSRGHYCGAQTIWSINIDEAGHLYSCQRDLGIQEKSFGTAESWNPADPIKTASRADRLTCYLNTAGAVNDAECAQCVWLPGCAGGCPNDRLGGKKNCFLFRDCPEEMVLALYRNLREKGKTREEDASQA